MLGFEIVSTAVSYAEDVIDVIGRWVWSRLDLEIVSTARSWRKWGRGG